MPIETDWGNLEENLIIFKVQGKWTGAEFVHAMDNVQKLAQSTPQSVMVLADMRYAMAATPQNFTTLLKSYMQRKADCLQRVVVVTHSMYWERIVSIIESSSDVRFPISIEFVKTVDEALTLLENDANIADD